VGDDEPGRGEPRRRRAARQAGRAGRISWPPRGSCPATEEGRRPSVPRRRCSAADASPRLLQADRARRDPAARAEPCRDRLAARRPETSTGRHRARRCPQPQPNPCQTGAEPATTRSGWNGPAAPTRTTTAPRSRRRSWRRRASASRHREAPRAGRVDPVERGRHRGGPLRPGWDVDQEELREDHAQLPRRGQPQAPQADGRHPRPRGVHRASRARASEVAPGAWVRVTVPRRRPAPAANPRRRAGRAAPARAPAPGLRPQAHRTEGAGLGAVAVAAVARAMAPSVANRCSVHKRPARRRTALPDRSRVRTDCEGHGSRANGKGSPARSAGGPFRASSRARRARPWGAHPSAPMARACASSTTACPGQDRHPGERTPGGRRSGLPRRPQDSAC
jgi:hypothetical protein